MWAPLALLYSLLLLLLGGGHLREAHGAALVTFTPTSSFPNRYARNVCSLVASSASDILEHACQLSSLYGSERGRVRMAFGETNCTVTLRNCVPGVCYSVRDATAVVARDQVPRPPGGPSSVFASLGAAAGADKTSFTNDGFSFRASSKTVTLEYSTHTCASYHSYRGRGGAQECRGAFAAVTEVSTGMPISLGC